MDMLHHKDAAELIFTAMQPVVDAGAHLYRAVYDLLGGVPIEGDLLPNNDIADKVNLASGGLAMVSAISLVIGHKMNEMLDNLDWKKAVESNRDEQHAHESQ